MLHAPVFITSSEARVTRQPTEVGEKLQMEAF
ncbi:MAG: hypothetical protein K940chlam7_00296 [Chlamydiae bacterium]|nr:hypothetical protein [Chlamydiota bacterium]